MRPALIGISGAAGSGKSEVASILASSFGLYRARRLRFAAPLKDMLKGYLVAAGMPPALARRYIEEDLKETPLGLLNGHSTRHAMQTLGTEWGRQCLGEDFWVNAWKDRAERLLETGYAVIVEDCRFANEAETIRSMGGHVIRVAGQVRREVPEHASEAPLPANLIDHIIRNTGTLEDLRCDTERALLALTATA